MRQIYICSDTFTGLCSALHDAWTENRNGEAGIELRGKTQQHLFCQYKTVVETEQKSQRFQRMLKRYLGYSSYREICHALLSDDAEKGTEVFCAVQAARMLPDSRKIMNHLGNPHVAKVFAMSRRVSNEAHMYEEFIRFRELKNGILFSEISPKTQILICIGDHFANRFPLESWLIYDKTHEVFLIHKPGEDWVLIHGEKINSAAIFDLSAGERDYEELWKGYFESAAIQERNNLSCQRNHLPYRFREHMTEFT